ncbi:aspartate/glutamate racemase family protein [Bauldia sp.]|uniref:aspartate/glutamate racemase family protein n=1 Tax=Bauldia sp. TaxID=2575872 RepID=UPI00345BC00D
MPKILVINPNSSDEVTEAMDAGIELLRSACGPEIACVSLPEGPPGIETQEHVESVVLPLARRISSTPADAYVIGCFSDPGLNLARETTDRPVVGIAESAFLLAMGLGYRFGIVAILETSIPRHMRLIRSLGLEDRLAGDRAIGFGVAELADEDRVIGRIVEVGTQLREDGADSVILGCASMGRYRPRLEQSLGIPVVDPCQAGVARALDLLSLGYRRMTM